MSGDLALVTGMLPGSFFGIGPQPPAAARDAALQEMQPCKRQPLQLQLKRTTDACHPQGRYRTLIMQLSWQQRGHQDPAAAASPLSTAACTSHMTPPPHPQCWTAEPTPFKL